MEPPSSLSGREGDAIEGTYSVKRITFFNKESSFGVLYLVPADRPTELGFVAVGRFPEPQLGDCYRIKGVWRRDPRHGMQVRVSSAIPQMPTSLSSIERYLAGSSIKGLGPHYAQALVDHFGEDTLSVLQAGGERLEEVSGIGPVRAQTIRESWAEHRGIHELMVNLQGVAELSPNQAQRIYRQYGKDAWLIISRDPYRLAEEIRGFGFRTCDRIARTLGMARDAPQRLQAGIIHLLKGALAEGHLWSARKEVIPEAARLLDVPDEMIPPQVEALVAQQRLICEAIEDGGDSSQGLYLPRVAVTERRVAARLAQLLRQPTQSRLNLGAAEARRAIESCDQGQLTDEQGQTIAHLLRGRRLVILTGGPGTGKTMTVRSLVSCLEALGVSYALCATTGRASKQLAMSTERNASTVHRHLGIGIGRGDITPVRETVLIIDESSMIDLWLLDDIVARLTPRTHLCLVGDVDQLPSVGPGAVLQDLIAADGSLGATRLAVTRLTRIFRQQAGTESLIVVNCHRVRQGLRPHRANDANTDYFEMHRDTPEQARELAVSLVARRLPKYLGIPASEVQLLAPMHGGQAGIRALNEALQTALNPASADRVELELSGVGRYKGQKRILREGDKIRQTRNNYQKGVLNGDLGAVSRIDLQTRTVEVRFETHTVTYPFEELDELVHAWAMTVHSAQGSQWPAVVVVMLKSHYIMLERNILYTALSRAERLAVLITQEQALRVAISRDRSLRRRTGLVTRLFREYKDDVSHGHGGVPTQPPL